MILFMWFWPSLKILNLPSETVNEHEQWAGVVHGMSVLVELVS